MATYVFSDAPYPSYIEDMAYQHSPFARTEDVFMDVSLSGFIDPNLQSQSPTPSFPSKWEPPQVQRYLKENQTTTFFHADVPSQVTASRGCMRSAVGIPPVPPPSQSARYASPISSIEQSSSSSGSVRSPPADTESFYDSNFPGTPPDTTLLSPFQQHNSFDWNINANALQFTSMGPAEGYVNPIDVNPSQQLEYCDSESGLPDFNFPSRGNSFESYTSGASLAEGEPAHNQITLDLRTKRVASPDEMPPAKAEIEASGHYLPPAQGSSEEEWDSDKDPVPHAPKRPIEDDDSEYQPSKRPRPSRTPARRPAPKSKHAAAVTMQLPNAPAPPPAKKGSKSSFNSVSQSTPKALPPSPGSAKGIVSCVECTQPQHFKDQVSLDNHIKKHHTRAFICVFNFAGCDSTFASKNEWKRHVLSQHLLLNYWLCQEGICGKQGNASHGVPSSTSSKAKSRGGDGVANLPNGAVFNRKDLYTQHLRRMHTPPQIKKSLKQAASKKAADDDAAAAATGPSNNSIKADWEEHVRSLQQGAVKDRCKLPETMQCPASGCDLAFHGADAWDQRMEHVARHLERAAAGKEVRVVFGGPGDPTLIQWAARADVAIIKKVAPSAARPNGWELNNPLKAGTPRGSAAVALSSRPVNPPPAVLVAEESLDEEEQEEEEQQDEIVVSGEEEDGDDDDNEEDDLRDAEGEEDDEEC
ncbi:hypothetical protein B0H63DRAFT_454420 [Podospora didyma]|uniref:C2H2-type domain-containing protein n=1 Tax=Podospora didyma TaxID=330526 RepID=A0AAE0K6I0_9PEZI|nr:hypothetical protein B0H63DRAFT_454420 [Podospora didyma]